MKMNKNKKEQKEMDFYTAFHYLDQHPIFCGRFMQELYVEVVKVDPKTRCIENDKSRNTKTEIWFEIGPYEEFEEEGIFGTHDLDLDCGGDTFEEAIIKLAGLVHQKYD